MSDSRGTIDIVVGNIILYLMNTESIESFSKVNFPTGSTLFALKVVLFRVHEVYRKHPMVFPSRLFDDLKTGW